MLLLWHQDGHLSCRSAPLLTKGFGSVLENASSLEITPERWPFKQKTESGSISSSSKSSFTKYGNFWRMVPSALQKTTSEQ